MHRCVGSHTADVHMPNLSAVVIRKLIEKNTKTGGGWLTYNRSTLQQSILWNRRAIGHQRLASPCIALHLLGTAQADQRKQTTTSAYIVSIKFFNSLLTSLSS